MTISITPNVLVIHLKRFSFGGFSGKINKPVDFDLTLDVPSSGNKMDDNSEMMKSEEEYDSKKEINSKMSKKDKKNKSCKIKSANVGYNLVGVVVHHGSSIHSGHYVAFVKVSSSNRTFH